jgi:hypothetical protein
VFALVCGEDPLRKPITHLSFSSGSFFWSLLGVRWMPMVMLERLGVVQTDLAHDDTYLFRRVFDAVVCLDHLAHLFGRIAARAQPFLQVQLLLV